MTGLTQTFSAEELDKVIVVALDRIAQAFRSLLWDQAREWKLSPIQIQFMVYIANKPEGMSSVSELARRFDLTPATVSDAVTTLERKGLLRKKGDSEDRRKIHLHLSKKGREIAGKLTIWQDGVLQELHRFPVKQKENVILFLLELLERMRRDNIVPEAKTCLSCSYFQRDVTGDPDEPHYCLLRNIRLKTDELRIDCPNYQPGED